MIYQIIITRQQNGFGSANIPGSCSCCAICYLSHFERNFFYSCVYDDKVCLENATDIVSVLDNYYAKSCIISYPTLAPPPHLQ